MVAFGLLLVVLLLGAAPAQAATAISYPRSCNSLNECRAAVVFDAGPGEANALRVDLEPDAVVLRDAGAELSPGPRCAAVQGGGVRCPLLREAGTSRLVTLRTGDGDDGVEIRDDADNGDTSVSADLGEGDDRYLGGGTVAGQGGDDVLRATGAASLDGGDGADTLAGGAGDDALNGGRDADALTGGEGDDVLGAVDGGVATTPDRIDGGRGRDVLSYAGGSRGVTVDLAAAGPQGGTPEQDDVAGVEDVEGGFGPDRLFGDDADNVLIGDFGDDLVVGRGGDDVLVGFRNTGGIGPDRGAEDVLDGGAGSDRLVTGPTQTSLGLCGAGQDVIRPGVGSPPRSRECERWTLGFGRGVSSVAIPDRVPHRRARIVIPCPRRAAYVKRSTCAVRGVIRQRGGRILARDKDRSPQGGRMPLALGVSPRPRGVVRIEIAIRLIDPQNRRFTQKTGLIIELPAR